MCARCLTAAVRCRLGASWPLGQCGIVIGCHLPRSPATRLVQAVEDARVLQMKALEDARQQHYKALEDMRLLHEKVQADTNAGFNKQVGPRAEL